MLVLLIMVSAQAVRFGGGAVALRVHHQGVLACAHQDVFRVSLRLSLLPFLGVLPATPGVRLPLTFFRVTQHRVLDTGLRICENLTKAKQRWQREWALVITCTAHGQPP